MRDYHGGFDGWICAGCEKSYPAIAGVAGHFPKCPGQIQAAEAVVLEHTCMYCERSFRTKIGLGQHVKKAHPVQANSQALPLKNKRVSEALIDCIAMSEADIPVLEVRKSRINIQIWEALNNRFPDIALETNVERIKNIKKGDWRNMYLERVAVHRAARGTDQGNIRGFPRSRMAAQDQPQSPRQGTDEASAMAAPPPVDTSPERPTTPANDPEVTIDLVPNQVPLQTTPESLESPQGAIPPDDQRVEAEPEGQTPDPPNNGIGDDRPPPSSQLGTLQPTQPHPETAVAVGEGNEPGRSPATPPGNGQGSNPPSPSGPTSPITADGDREDPRRRTPVPPGSDQGGDPPSPSSPTPPVTEDPNDPLTEAVRVKLRQILAARTNNPLACDLNTVAEECLAMASIDQESKLLIFNRVEEVLRKHRPKIWEEPPPRRNPPRRDNIPLAGNRAARRKHRFAKAQRLFQRKPKELMRRDILDEGRQEGAYTPSTEEAFETYQGRFGVPSKREESEAPPVGDHDLDLIWAPLTKKEVEIALRSMPNSAAGPVFSRINKGALKSIGSLALHRIFLMWQIVKDMPGWCKVNRTILIPKKTVPGSINDFRPLTIGSHLSRLFTRAFATRLTKNLPLHHRQKAFRPVDGCGENLALIEGIIADARKRSKTLYITFVDVAKAFDTVSHHSIERALCRLRCPKPFVSLVRNLYEGAQTRIHVDGVDTEVIRITNGVKQGCPLSPLLFNSITDELLHQIGEIGGYELIGGVRVASMAFADDLILISSSREGMARSLGIMDSFFQARGMKVQPPKCCTIGLEKRRDGGLKMDMRPFHLQDPTTGSKKTMKVLGPGDWMKYLGLEVGSAGLKRDQVLRDESIRSLTEELEHLHRLPLKANQKIHLLRTYTIPGLQYRWTKGPANLNMLRQADTLILSKLRTWLKIFHSVPNAFFRVPISDGGLGIPAVQDLVITGKARLHAKLCKSTDPAVAHVARSYLWGKELRQYARRLNGFELGGEDDGSDLNRKVRADHRNQLQNSTHCKGAETFRDDPLGNSVINDATVKTGLVIDMVKLRTQTFPVKMSIRQTQQGAPDSYNTTCRKPGCTRDESASHVLQECPSVHGLRVKRHELVDQQCTKWITDKGFLTIKEPVIRSRLDGNTYKPDRLYCHPGSDTLYVLDWTVPYEISRAAMKDSERAKERKYSPLKDQILDKARELFPGKEFNDVVFRGIAFGARGAILPNTREFLHKKLGMTKMCISWIQHRVAQRSICMVKTFFAGSRE